MFTIRQHNGETDGQTGQEADTGEGERGKARLPVTNKTETTRCRWIFTGVNWLHVCLKLLFYTHMYYFFYTHRKGQRGWVSSDKPVQNERRQPTEPSVETQNPSGKHEHHTSTEPRLDCRVCVRTQPIKPGRRGVFTHRILYKYTVCHLHYSNGEFGLYAWKCSFNTLSSTLCIISTFKTTGLLF